MKLGNIVKSRHFVVLSGALLTALLGLTLWGTSLGEGWVNASYDYLFRFGSHPVTNQVVLIKMDNEAYDYFHQMRGAKWNRALHAQLLNRLADDGCSLVVLDIFFQEPGEPEEDQAMLKALQRLPKVVLMAKQAELGHPTLDGVHPILPINSFLNAARTNWGIGWLYPDLDSIVRHHWPFPAPGPCPSLPWTAARIANAHPDEIPEEQWLRYYGLNGGWTSLSYRFAMTQPAHFFRNKVVFIGNSLKTTVADEEADKFRTPYTRWTGEAASGMEIQATVFLNLLNKDWLRRPPWWIDFLALSILGLGLGGCLCQVRLLAAFGIGMATVFAITLGAVWFSYASNYWMPWFVTVGGQVPCALTWAVVASRIRQQHSGLAQKLPVTPGYQLIYPPFAEGAYGNVWLARNAVGQWQALKTVYLAKFSQNPDPYEREFNGVKRYKPVSDKHPGLLRVEFVSRNEALGYFFYVMELGDALIANWEKNPHRTSRAIWPACAIRLPDDACHWHNVLELDLR